MRRNLPVRLLSLALLLFVVPAIGNTPSGTEESGSPAAAVVPTKNAESEPPQPTPEEPPTPAPEPQSDAESEGETPAESRTNTSSKDESPTAPEENKETPTPPETGTETPAAEVSGETPTASDKGEEVKGTSEKSPSPSPASGRSVSQSATESAEPATAIRTTDDTAERRALLLSLARIQREKAGQRLALRTAQSDSEQLSNRLRHEPARVTRGRVTEASVQQAVIRLSADAAKWEEQLEQVAQLRRQWRVQRDTFAQVGNGLRAVPPVADGDVASLAAHCEKESTELLDALTQLSRTLTANVQQAGNLSEELARALDESRRSALTLQSQSRLSWTTFSAAAAQVRNWRQPIVDGLKQWLAEHAQSYYLFLLLTAVVIFAVSVGGNLLPRLLTVRSSDETSPTEATPQKAGWTMIARPVIACLGALLSLPLLKLTESAHTVASIAVVSGVAAWASLAMLSAWVGGGEPTLRKQRARLTRPATALILSSAVCVPLLSALIIYGEAATPTELLVQVLYGAVVAVSLTWITSIEFGALPLSADPSNATQRHLHVAVQVGVPMLCCGVLAVLALRALGYYNLSIYIGKNLPLSAAVLVLVVWAYRKGLPRLIRFADWPGFDSEESAACQRTTHALLRISYGSVLFLLACAALLRFWGRSDATDRLLFACLTLASGVGIGGLAGAVVLSRLLLPMRLLGGQWNAALTRALCLPLVLLGVLIGLPQAALLLTSSTHHVAVVRFYRGALAVLLTYTVLRLVSCLARHSLRLAREQGRTDAVPGVLLARKVGSLVVMALGVTFVLNQLGYKITPLLASLGIASIAVAMALQDTLKNLFAGFYIMMDCSLKPGDYVALNSGEDGFIEDIGWRNTKIRPWRNNMIIIPNSRLSEAVVTNQNLPSQEQSVYIACGVSYESDLEHVERVCIEVATETMARVQGSALDWTPVVRYKEFGDSNINFVVVLRVKEFAAQYLLTHEFIKALFRRFNEEGIEINYPVRNVYLRQVESDGAVRSSASVPAPQGLLTPHSADYERAQEDKNGRSDQL